MQTAIRDTARKRLIFALDVPKIEDGLALLDRVQGQIGLVKIGLELYTAAGPSAVSEVKKRGFGVFLDLKLHDIPNTVAGAVRSARALGVDMLTVHTGGGGAMLAAALDECGDALKILGVTLLTSLGADDLDPVAIVSDPAEVVRRRAALAANIGLGGVVCSPREIKRVRATIGPDISIVTPGIRPTGAALGDQKRAATPRLAITDGADYLVVGRPIGTAPDPAQAAAAIVDEIALALEQK